MPSHISHPKFKFRQFFLAVVDARDGVPVPLSPLRANPKLSCGINKQFMKNFYVLVDRIFY
jgi:hypothetical protein